VAEQATADNRIRVGRIGGAHGTRGEVRLKSFTADPLAIADYGALQTADGARSFTIEAMRGAGGTLIVRFTGVGDRTSAEKLRNIDLYVSRDCLPPPASDEYYHTDLIGLAAVGKNGRAFGTVIAVHDFGAGDILELRQPDTRDTLLLPFTEATVPEVDIAGGRIVIDPPQGLFKRDEDER
jgi:16S rRNA processing protein RimM